MAKVIHNPVLGSLEWDEKVRCWRGGLDLPSGRRIDLKISLPTDEHAEHPEALAVFHAAYITSAWLRETEEQVYLDVSRALLELYNDGWSQEDPITAEEFARRIELGLLEVPYDGKGFTLYFTDGEMEMFGGHLIVARFEDRQLRRAHLAG